MCNQASSYQGTCWFQTRKAVVITSRVHPGESNSSLMMKGYLDYLLSDENDAKVKAAHPTQADPRFLKKRLQRVSEGHVKSARAVCAKASVVHSPSQDTRRLSVELAISV